MMNRELTMEQMEAVVGGTFTPNLYSVHTYKDAGIKVVRHFIDKDEFWWNGENIGHYNANAVTYYKLAFGYVPATVDDAVRYYEKWN